VEENILGFADVVVDFGKATLDFLVKALLQMQKRLVPC
jgi:hypothetical protein